jgi:glycosyltransferase involved in cell wall biosynthesis
MIPGLSYPHPPRLLELSLSYLKKAACIITPSKTVKRDVIRYCECREDNVHVVHHGIDKRFRPFPSDQRLEQRRRFGLPLDDHLILISGHQAYKNHGTCFLVVEKLRQTLRREVCIVRVGDCSKIWTKQNGRHRHNAPVIDLGHLPPDVMPSVYNAVDCLLFSSWYEGFGWPPLEAIACGVPVVASNAGSPSGDYRQRWLSLCARRRSHACGTASGRS